MKKSLLTLIAASALSLGASAQTQYIMQVTKTNGQVELINADEVESVSFIQGELSPKVQIMSEIRNSLYGLASKKLDFAGLNTSSALLAEMTRVMTSDEGVMAAIKQDVVGKVMGQVKPVEEGSELAQAGYEKYAVIDYKLFDGIYSFDDYGEMKKEVSDGQLIVNFPSEVEGFSGNISLSFKGSGNASEILVPYSKDKSIGLIIRLPETIDIAMSNKDGVNLFEGKLTYAFEKKSASSTYFRPLEDKWTISLVQKGHLKELNDENTINMKMSYDGSTGVIVSEAGLEKNGQSIIERKAQVTVPILTQIPMLIQMMGGMTGLNNGSPLDIIAQILASGSAKDMISGISAMVLNGAKIDNYEVTLLGDMNIAVSVSDIYTTIQTVKAMKEARRNGADAAAISQFAESLNNTVQLTLKFKKLDKELPAKLVAAKVGVDNTILPAVSADGKEFTPLTQLIDINSTGYLMNIIDHCVEPLSKASTSFGIIAGNLIKFFTLDDNDDQEVVD